MTTLAQLGSRFKAARKKKALTIQQLAERSQTNRNRVALFERGLANVELNTLLVLCDELGLDVVLVPKEVSSQLSSPPSSDRLTGMRARVARRLGQSVLQDAPSEADKDDR